EYYMGNVRDTGGLKSRVVELRFVPLKASSIFKNLPTAPRQIPFHFINRISARGGGATIYPGALLRAGFWAKLDDSPLLSLRPKRLKMPRK
ncbi:MAG: hypothetical protein JJU46_11220, partial [Balneolaceae bacterium]|nr:hypothetical protein [Balneolaceae bacterium]